MVEHSLNYDMVFQALADKTRRDIVRRTLGCDCTISELSESYHMSFAAVAKHVNVLARAHLVHKARHGREQVVQANVKTISSIAAVLITYENMWVERFNRLDELLQE